MIMISILTLPIITLEMLTRQMFVRTQVKRNKEMVSNNSLLKMIQEEP